MTLTMLVMLAMPVVPASYCEPGFTNTCMDHIILQHDNLYAGIIMVSVLTIFLTESQNLKKYKVRVDTVQSVQPAYYNHVLCYAV